MGALRVFSYKDGVRVQLCVSRVRGRSPRPLFDTLCHLPTASIPNMVPVATKRRLYPATDTISRPVWVFSSCSTAMAGLV